MKHYWMVVLLVCVISCNSGQGAGIIKDSRLERAVREAIGKNHGNLTRADLSLVKKLYCSRVKSLQGVQFMDNLRDAGFMDGEYDDLSPIAGLKSLWSLNLSRSNIKEIAFLAGLENLEYLILTGNEIQDITPLTGLKKLKVLLINQNQIHNLSPIVHLENLEDLMAAANHVTRLPDFSLLNKLRVVDLSYNEIGNNPSLQTLRGIPEISLVNSGISDCKWFIDWIDIGRINLLKNPIGCPRDDERFNALVRSGRLLVDCAN